MTVGKREQRLEVPKVHDLFMTLKNKKEHLGSQVDSFVRLKPDEPIMAEEGTGLGRLL
jgi:hypothetical protein